MSMSVQNKQRDGGPHPHAGSRSATGGKNDTTGITKPLEPARNMRLKAPVKEDPYKQWGRGSEQQWEKLP